MTATLTLRLFLAIAIAAAGMPAHASMSLSLQSPSAVDTTTAIDEDQAESGNHCLEDERDDAGAETPADTTDDCSSTGCGSDDCECQCAGLSLVVPFTLSPLPADSSTRSPVFAPSFKLSTHPSNLLRPPQA